MIPSRATALRSTALATSLALAVGVVFPLGAWAAPKVPLPKPRPIARNAVPKPAAQAAAPAAAHTPTAAPAAAAPVLAPATRQHAALPPPRKSVRRPRSPRRVRRRKPTATPWRRHRTGAQASPQTRPRRRTRSPIRSRSKLAEWLILRSDNNGASVERYRAFITANPSWPSQTFLRRRSEAALWDDRRDDAAVVVWFANETPMSAKGTARACARRMLARGDRTQCRAAGPRGLARRCDVGRHRGRRARDVRRAADGGRPQGANGYARCTTETRARRHARRQAPRLGAMSRWSRRASPSTESRPTPRRCSMRCRTNCTAIPATCSAASSSCAATTRFPRPRSSC